MENNGTVIPVENGAEAFLEVLNANGVDFIFMNAGTSSGSLQEALAKYNALGKKAPQVITSLHEYVALSAAQGYHMVSCKPQLVLVHLALGTLQLGGALLNAQRNRSGVVICATRVPYGREGNKAGMPAFALHWIHEEADQAAPVRDYVKWEYEIRSVETIREVTQRAFRISSTDPYGATYLALPQDLLGERLSEVTIPPVARYGGASAPQLDPVLTDEIAGILVKAENPLIITGYSGRNPDSVEPLVKLAEGTGARVFSSQAYVNFPSDHPLFGGFGVDRFIKEADVIMTVDCDVPYVAGRSNMSQDTKLIHLDIDPVKLNLPMWGFAADILACCDSCKAFVQLNELIAEKVSDTDRKRIDARYRKAQEDQAERPAPDWDAVSQGKPVSPNWLCHCIDEILDQEAVIVEETVTNRGAVLSNIRRTVPGTLFNNQGASLGWGLGAALGAKLAAPDKTVVSLVGDGTFVFGSPIATFWAANRYKAPFLCVVFNNGRYNAPRAGIQAADGGESYSAKTNNWVGSDITPSPNYAEVCKACGGYGRVVEDAAEVKQALQEAMAEVKNGKAALLDMRI
ncbi:MAG: thiamine pyrophosphate-requiring protein [Dehalococcoidales bacterium]|nr:thiamine pyrophosphate-requiring protein [Dehalococcoidales bacterium]